MRNGAAGKPLGPKMNGTGQSPNKYVTSATLEAAVVSPATVTAPAAASAAEEEESALEKLSVGGNQLSFGVVGSLKAMCEGTRRAPTSEPPVPQAHRPQGWRQLGGL